MIVLVINLMVDVIAQKMISVGGFTVLAKAKGECVCTLLFFHTVNYQYYTVGEKQPHNRLHVLLRVQFFFFFFF